MSTSPAGSLAAWFTQMVGVLSNGGEMDVPCGTCDVCCRSSMFIRVEEDDPARSYIPAALLVPAPGEPGVSVMGYDEEGRCPMLGSAGCTIYDDRPRGCRVFDCRVFAATGVDPAPVHVELRERSQRWAFDSVAGEDRTVRLALEKAGSRMHADGIASALELLGAARAELG